MREFYRIFLILIIFSLSCYGQDKKRDLDIDALSESWIKLSSDSLLRMGDRLSIFPAAPDSALLCYSIVEAKEGARTERVKSLAMVEAMLGKAKLYSYRLQNYGEAYECLMRALEIVDNTPSHNGYKPVIFFRLASVCHSLYEIQACILKIGH